MELNIEPFMSGAEILQLAHKVTAVPSIILMYLSATTLFWISALLVLNKQNTNWGKVFLMWVIFSLLLGGITLFLALSPNTVNAIGSAFSST